MLACRSREERWESGRRRVRKATALPQRPVGTGATSFLPVARTAALREWTALLASGIGIKQKGTVPSLGNSVTFHLRE